MLTLPPVWLIAYCCGLTSYTSASSPACSSPRACLCQPMVAVTSRPQRISLIGIILSLLPVFSFEVSTNFSPRAKSTTVLNHTFMWTIQGRVFIEKPNQTGNKLDGLFMNRKYIFLLHQNGSTWFRSFLRLYKPTAIVVTMTSMSKLWKGPPSPLQALFLWV